MGACEGGGGFRGGGLGEGVDSTIVSSSRALTITSNWNNVSLTSWSKGLGLDWEDCTLRTLGKIKEALP